MNCDLLEQSIPTGVYCYSGSRMSDDPNFKVCPYWRQFDEYPLQESGYCTYLKLGDYMEDGTLLLWDQVKECGINEDFDIDSALILLGEHLAIY
jgi:hypothetical protein